MRHTRVKSYTHWVPISMAVPHTFLFSGTSDSKLYCGQWHLAFMDFILCLAFSKHFFLATASGFVTGSTNNINALSKTCYNIAQSYPGSHLSIIHL